MTTAVLTEATLLAVWEAGLGKSALSQALLLAAVAGGGDAVDPADLSLGRRDALLLALRERCFGPELPCTVSCPQCADRLEMSLAVADLRVDPPDVAVEAELGEVDMAGVRVTFRVPTSRDLSAIDPDGPAARRRLVSACIVAAQGAHGPVPVAELSDEVIDAVAGHLGDDPQSDIVLALTCASCGHDWEAPFDVPGFLWYEVDAYARRLLHEVHALATAYGWSEAEVLTVSPTRRRFYLEVGVA